MPNPKIGNVALVWSQFADHHIDRCVALAELLGEKAQIHAIAVASSSREYSGFAAARDHGGLHRSILFPGRAFHEVPRWRRFLQMLRICVKSRAAFIGVPFGESEVVALLWTLKLLGKNVYLMCDSKFDDYPRSSAMEFAKRIAFACLDGVVVGGSRGTDYFHFLGMRRRPIVMGADTIDVARIRNAAASARPVSFASRDFVFVGRFIPKKNIARLIDAFARYCEIEPTGRRKLVLIGTGPLEADLRDQVTALGLAERIEFAGFVAGPELYGRIAQAIALILPSHSEQWGLVINEALALGVPVITAQSAGARDILVRAMVNGIVVETGSIDGFARAMQHLGADESEWARMSDAAYAAAELGDVRVFAEALACLLDPVLPAGPLTLRSLAESDAFRGFPIADSAIVRQHR